MYAEINAQDEVLAYPLLLSQIKKMFRHIAIARVPQDRYDLAGRIFVKVVSQDRPDDPDQVFTMGTPEKQGDEWVQTWDGRSLNEQEVTDRTASLLRILASYRWEKETGGLTLPGGLSVATDDRAQTKLIGARIEAEANPGTYTVDWKTPNGFQTLNAAQVIAVSSAVSAHVKKCFAIEAAIISQIISLELKTGDEVRSAFDAAFNA